RQAPAALRRPHCRVSRHAPRGHPCRPDRLYRSDLWRARLAHRRVQVPQEVRPRPRSRTGPHGGAHRATAGHGVAVPARGAARRHAGAPLLLGRTHYAGAFLMLGEVLGWLAIAQQCFPDTHGTLTRGLLTSAFAPVVGLERLWHLDEMEDLGFALLTGGR